MVGLSAAGRCPLTGPVWGEGNILLGGGGSDTITGRGADDIIDGDRSLSVRISVRANADGTGAEIGSTDLMENTYQPGNPKTLQEAVFDGTIDPGQLVTVREIKAAPAGDTGVDTAVFLAPESSYTVTTQPDGSVVVSQTGPVNRPAQKVSDGTDTLRGIERIQFTEADGTAAVLRLTPPTVAPTGVAVLQIAPGTARVSFVPATGAAAATDSPTTSFLVQAFNGTTPVGDPVSVPTTQTSGIISDLPAATLTFTVRAVNAFGIGPAASSTPQPITVLAGAPSAISATRGNTTVALTWTAPADTGGTPLTGYLVQVRSGSSVVRTVPLTGTATTTTVTGLTNGQAYTFAVAARNANGTGAFSAPSAAVVPASAPTVAPTGLVVTQTGLGTATVSFTAATPAGADGGSPVTSFAVQAFNGTTAVGSPASVPGTATSAVVTGLPRGTLTFTVRAVNAVGAGPAATSAAKAISGLAGAPTAVSGTRGNTAVALRWTAPADNGGTALTGYAVQVRSGTAVVKTVTLTGTATTTTVTGLTNGRSYTFAVAARNANGTGGFSAASAALVPASAPTAAPVGITATAGTVGAPVTAVTRRGAFAATGTGGSAVTGFQVLAYRVVGSSNVLVAIRTVSAPTTGFTYPGLVNGATYRFRWRAVNAVGTGPLSAFSNAVVAR